MTIQSEDERLANEAHDTLANGVRSLIADYCKIMEETDIAPLVGGVIVLAENTTPDSNEYIFTLSDDVPHWVEVGILHMRSKIVETLMLNSVLMGGDEDE